MIDASGGLLAALLRFAALTATTGALGAWMFAHFVIPRLPPGSDDALRRDARVLAVRAARWCLAVLALTAIARLLAPAAPATGVGLAASAAAQSLWGKALFVQGVASAIAFAVLLVRRDAHPWPRAAQVGLAVVALVPPFLAHAGTASELRLLAIVVDVVHGLSAGGWVGALALLTIAVASGRRAADAPVRTAQLVGAFHPVAVIAAPTVFATGLLTAWLRMGAPVGIASPTYSGLFVAKLVLVGVTGFVGAGHSKLATRRVAAVAPAAIGRTLAAECGLAVVVLALTAVLVGTAPID